MTTNDDQAARNDEERDIVQAEAMTVVQLKDKLKRRKLKTTDNNVDLVERFRAAMLLENQKDKDADVNNDIRDQTNHNDDGESDSSDESEDDEQRRRPTHGSRRHGRCLFLQGCRGFERYVQR